MHEKTHDPVQLLVLGKGTVSALVGKNPDASEDHSLHNGIGSPKNGASVDIRNVFDVGGHVDEGRDVEEVSNDVCHRTKDGGLEAVIWDSIVDLLHGEVGELEDFTSLGDVLLFFWFLPDWGRFPSDGCHDCDVAIKASSTKMKEKREMKRQVKGKEESRDEEEEE